MGRRKARPNSNDPVYEEELDCFVASAPRNDAVEATRSRTTRHIPGYIMEKLCRLRDRIRRVAHRAQGHRCDRGKSSTGGLIRRAPRGAGASASMSRRRRVYAACARGAGERHRKKKSKTWAVRRNQPFTPRCSRTARELLNTTWSARPRDRARGDRYGDAAGLRGGRGTARSNHHA